MQLRRLLALSAATLLSAIVAALLTVLLTATDIEEPWNIVVASETARLMRLTFAGALGVALVLGLPFYLFLESKRRTSAVYCALGGFLVGAFSAGVLAVIFLFGMDNASTGGRATVISGVPTLAGWLEAGQAAGLVGLFGLAGGLAFWLALRLSGEAPKPSAGLGAQSLTARQWSVASAASLATCAVLLLPTMVTDDSCHNLFRDGRRSVVPQISAHMKLTSEDWPTLWQTFVDVGAVHSLSFRADEKLRDGRILWRNLSLCNETGVTIEAMDKPWLEKIKSSVAGQGISLSIFELKAGSGWNPLARDLLGKIEERWPGKTTFDGPQGTNISLDEALRGRR